MFSRLYLSYLVVGLLAGVLVGLGLARLWEEVFAAKHLILVLAGVAALSLLPAWWFARQFTDPYEEIREGAERIARGEYGLRIHGGSWREMRELAHRFNEMSHRLRWQFEQLEAERHQLRTILGGMVEGVVAIGSGQRVLFANEAAGKMLEFDPQVGIGRPFYEMTRQPAVKAILERSLKDRLIAREVVEFKGPSLRHLTIYVAPLHEEEGAVMVLQDTSDLRRLERMRQEFVANVSHELKTPLAVVKATVEALQDGAVEDPEAREPFLQQIADQADRLHALILDLLSLARIESGEELFDFQEVDVDQAVEECVARHGTRAQAKQIDVRLVPPPTPLTVWADEEALGQILDNLVDNAIKYSSNGSQVRLEWLEQGGNVVLMVADTGPGIPANDLPRIFERFYRVDRARSRELGGTGLGLAIVKHLTQAMKGSVRASSELGQGTTFQITLPTLPRGVKQDVHASNT
jgi:two-component system phosphate regulon sensor histidine kinase PhoR